MEQLENVFFADSVLNVKASEIVASGVIEDLKSEQNKNISELLNEIKKESE